jgi:hypothetical protein
MTIFELRLSLAVFVIWAVAVTTAAAWRTSPRWTKWALFVPVVLFLRVNPFGSTIAALVFLMLSSAIAVLFGLSLPIAWGFGHLGSTWAVIVSALLLVIPFLLQGAAPRRRWLGVVLAGLLGPWGQWYLEDGGRWVIAVSAAAFAAGLVVQLVATLGMPGGGAPVRLPEFPQIWLRWPGLGFHLASAVVMYLRFSWSRADVRVASGASL